MCTGSTRLSQRSAKLDFHRLRSKTCELRRPSFLQQVHIYFECLCNSLNTTVKHTWDLIVRDTAEIRILRVAHAQLPAVCMDHRVMKCLNQQLVLRRCSLGRHGEVATEQGSWCSSEQAVCWAIWLYTHECKPQSLVVLYHCLQLIKPSTSGPLYNACEACSCLFSLSYTGHMCVSTCR